MTSLAQQYRKRQRRMSEGRPSISMTSEIEEAKKREDAVILNFLEHRDLPTWFRGLSRFQMIAAASLFNALRDDAEQRTTHRVSSCLRCIGLEPAICSKDVRLLIGLSRGNDLAFLWFLMELHYKSPKGTEGYNLNEMLILTVITHLDMLVTMRELDRVLPPVQKTKHEIARLKRIEEKKEALLRRKKKPKRVYPSPYFEKISRPKPYGKPLYVTMPGFVPKLGHYKEAYQNPNYVVQNESNRWFGTYKMQTGRRLSIKIIDEEIDRMFKDFTNLALRADTVQTLCEYHKVINGLEKNMETELKLIARNRCIKNFDNSAKITEETHKRIVDQLERDIAKYMCKFRKLTTTVRRESMCHVLTQDCECKENEDCQCEPEFGILDRLLGGKDSSDKSSRSSRSSRSTTSSSRKSSSSSKERIPLKKCRIEIKSKSSESDNSCNDHPFGQEEISEENENSEPLDTLAKADKAMKRSIRAELKEQRVRREREETTAKNLKSTHKGLDGCDDENSTESGSAESSENSGICDYCRNDEILETISPALESSAPRTRNSRVSLPAIDKKSTRLCSFSGKYVKAYNYGHIDAVTPTSSEYFFKAPSENLPYMFDYRKIFRPKDNTEKSIQIKRAFIEALDSDVALLSRLQDTPLSYEKPVHKCAHKIWKEQVALKNEELELEEQMRPKEIARKKKTPLDYDQDYYDPDDKELMHKMLKDALDYIAKNPKFVLASIPEADKLPVLREWIYNRFGKEYSRSERHQSFRKSVQIFHALDKVIQDIEQPTLGRLGTNSFVEYSCRDYLLKKSARIKKEFVRKVDANVMEQARIFWFAMVPWLCANGPPRDTYFAYMPSRSLDITRFRMWKPTEFMNAKRAWDIRQNEKAKAAAKF